MNPINLTLPLDTVKATIVALSKFPYEQAQPHIDLIRAQAEPQIQAHADAADLAAQQTNSTPAEGQPE